MSKKSENMSDLNKKDRNKRHSSPFINVVKGVFFVVRVTLVPVSYLSAPSAVHSYGVPGKFIRIDLFILKNMGVAIIDFRVCPPLVKCKNLMFSGFIDTLMYGFSSTGVTIYIQYTYIVGKYKIYLYEL